jgi:hypothetical protein
LIENWRDVLPASSLCLAVPIVPPSQWGTEVEKEQQEDVAEHDRGPPTEASTPETSA